VPNLPRLILGIPYATSHVYRLLRREAPAPEKRPKLLLDATTYALASQLGAYLGCKVPSLSRLSPKLHAKLHRLLGKGV
jgi:rhamnosyltransferase